MSENKLPRDARPSLSKTRHLQLKGLTWVYVRSTPKALEARLGGIKGITRSTGTGDISEAIIFRDQLNAKLEAMMEESLGTQFVQELDALGSLSNDDLDGGLQWMEDRLEDAHSVLGAGASFLTLLAKAGISEPQWLATRQARSDAAIDLPQGYELGSLRELLSRFQSQREGDHLDTTRRYVGVVGRFLSFLGVQDCNFLEISSRSNSIKYVDHLLLNYKSSSIKTNLSVLTVLWQWAADRSPEYEHLRNPFRGIKIPRKDIVQSYDFMGDDVLRDILERIRVPSNRLPAIIARHHGFRLGEMFTIMEKPMENIATVDGILCWIITRGKTDAAARRVPVHHSMVEVALELKAGTRSLCRSNNANALGQRFSGAKVALGLPKTIAFHSLRATFITLAMRSGASELVVAEIAGHSAGKTMSAQLYSKGYRTDQLQEVVDSVPHFDWDSLIP